MDPNLCPPPFKRRRLTQNQFVPQSQFHHLNCTSHHLNFYTPQPSANYVHSTPNCNVSHSLQTNHNQLNQNSSIASFKSQLNGIFELFPPFQEFIASQHDPYHSLEELYQVFIACDPSPFHPHTAYQHQITTADLRLNPARLQTDDLPDVHCISINNIDNHNTHNNITPPDHDNVPPITITSAAYPQLTTAKEKMIRHAHRNIGIRCNKIIDSFNTTTRNHSKCCFFLKHFTLNEAVKFQVIPRVTKPLEIWNGGNTPLPKILSDKQAFKLVRAHWNRQKAGLLGDILYCLVLANLFKIVLQTTSLSYKEQVMFYIDLFRGLLSEHVQFEQSMSRPVIPNACFDKAPAFKRLCENILQSFSNGVVSMTRIRSVKVCEVNGRKVTKYIKNVNRSQSLAKCYDNCLQQVESIISNATNESIHHSIQSHLNCIQTACDSELQLIEWKQMQAPIIAMKQTWTNTNNFNEMFNSLCNN